MKILKRSLLLIYIFFTFIVFYSFALNKGFSKKDIQYFDAQIPTQEIEEGTMVKEEDGSIKYNLSSDQALYAKASSTLKYPSAIGIHDYKKDENVFEIEIPNNYDQSIIVDELGDIYGFEDYNLTYKLQDEMFKPISYNVEQLYYSPTGDLYKKNGKLYYNGRKIDNNIEEVYGQVGNTIYYSVLSNKEMAYDIETSASKEISINKNIVDTYPTQDKLYIVTEVRRLNELYEVSADGQRKIELEKFNNLVGKINGKPSKFKVIGNYAYVEADSDDSYNLISINLTTFEAKTVYESPINDGGLPIQFYLNYITRETMVRFLTSYDMYNMVTDKSYMYLDQEFDGLIIDQNDNLEEQVVLFAEEEQ